jgi:UDP-glucose 4-epimerase
MKVFVTGGAGYIGSVCVEHLLKHGHQVTVFDNLQQGHRAAVPREASLIVGNLAHPTDIDKAFAATEPDAVMHFASRTSVAESIEKPFLHLGDNVRNGLNLLEAVVAHGITRFILSSTAALFGSPEKMPITDDERIDPGSPYGESKHILERTLHWLDQTSGVRYAALRYFNAAGATAERGEDHDPETHLIPLVLQVPLGQRDKIMVFGNDYPTRDGTCVRDYIHIVDLAEAHILALEALDGGSRAYNLGNGAGFTVLEVIEAAREVTGHPIPVEVGPRRGGDLAELIASSERIEQELGWKPRYPHVRDIVASAWRWHLQHPYGYQDR